MDSIDFFENLKEFEGFRSKPYKCPSGVLTIGYGHTFGVIPGMVVNKFQASNLLLLDIEVVKLQLSAIHSNFLSFPLGLRYALIDFVFNVGFMKYKNSSLCKVVANIKDYSHLTENEILSLSVNFSLWTKSKGKVLRGLERRRNWEISLLRQ